MEPQLVGIEYMAFDPGNTTGMAFFYADGTLARKGQLDFDTMLGFLSFLHNHLEGKTVIVEDFKLLPGKAQQMSSKHSQSLETSQILGAIKLMAKIGSHRLIVQPPSHLKPVQGWLDFNIESEGHAKSHWKSAYCHGMFYLIDTLNLITVKKAREHGTPR